MRYVNWCWNRCADFLHFLYVINSWRFGTAHLNEVTFYQAQLLLDA